MPFAHEQLDLYDSALDFALIVDKLSDRLPPRRRHLTDQLGRASTAIAVNIAGGAGRTPRLDRQRYFLKAEASSIKCAAVLDICRKLSLHTAAEQSDAKTLLERLRVELAIQASPQDGTNQGGTSGGGSALPVPAKALNRPRRPTSVPPPQAAGGDATDPSCTDLLCLETSGEDKVDTLQRDHEVHLPAPPAADAAVCRRHRSCTHLGGGGRALLVAIANNALAEVSLDHQETVAVPSLAGRRPGAGAQRKHECLHGVADGCACRQATDAVIGRCPPRTRSRRGLGARKGLEPRQPGI